MVTPGRGLGARSTSWSSGPAASRIAGPGARRRGESARTSPGFGDAGPSCGSPRPGDDLVLPGSFAISEVAAARAGRPALARPAGAGRGFPVDLVSLTRDPDRAACVADRTTLPCVSALTAPGEDGDTLARTLRGATGRPRTTSPAPCRCAAPSTACSLVRGTGLVRPATPARRTTSPRARRRCSTATPARPGSPRSPDEALTVEFPKPTAARHGRRRRQPRRRRRSRPTLLRVSVGGSTVGRQPRRHGTRQLPHWRVSSLDIAVVATDQPRGRGPAVRRAPAGISSLTFGDDAEAADEEKAATRTVVRLRLRPGHRARRPHRCETAVTASSAT